MAGRPPLRPAMLEAMSPAAREAYLYIRNRPASKPSTRDGAALFKRDMELEHAFAAAGGLLLAGPDPTGNGGGGAGFGATGGVGLVGGGGVSPAGGIEIADLFGPVNFGEA